MPISLSQYWAYLKPALLIGVFSLSALAQQPRSPQLPAPPPMRVVSREERSQLNTTDPKARLRTSMALTANRLNRMEESTSLKKFDQASEELGGYLGLLDNLRAYLGSMNRDKGSTRDLYRHFEIALRAHIPRLAVMRRTTPAAYAGNLKAAEEYVREARSDALDSFYGHSVLREDQIEKKPAGPPEGGKRP